MQKKIKMINLVFYKKASYIHLFLPVKNVFFSPREYHNNRATDYQVNTVSKENKVEHNYPY